MTCLHDKDLLHVKIPAPEHPPEPTSCKQQAEGGKGLGLMPAGLVLSLARPDRHGANLDPG